MLEYDHGVMIDSSWSYASVKIQENVQTYIERDSLIGVKQRGADLVSTLRGRHILGGGSRSSQFLFV